MPKLLIASGDGPKYQEIFAREAPELEVKLYQPDDPTLPALLEARARRIVERLATRGEAAARGNTFDPPRPCP